MFPHEMTLKQYGSFCICWTLGGLLSVLFSSSHLIIIIIKFSFVKKEGNM